MKVHAHVYGLLSSHSSQWISSLSYEAMMKLTVWLSGWLTVVWHWVGDCGRGSQGVWLEQ